MKVSFVNDVPGSEGVVNVHRSEPEESEQDEG